MSDGNQFQFLNNQALDNVMLLKASIWWAFVPAVFGTGLSAIVALITGLPMVSSAFRALEAR